MSARPVQFAAASIAATVCRSPLVSSLAIGQAWERLGATSARQLTFTWQPHVETPSNVTNSIDQPPPRRAATGDGGTRRWLLGSAAAGGAEGADGAGGSGAGVCT